MYYKTYLVVGGNRYGDIFSGSMFSFILGSMDESLRQFGAGASAGLTLIRRENYSEFCFITERGMTDSFAS